MELVKGPEHRQWYLVDGDINKPIRVGVEDNIYFTDNVLGGDMLVVINTGSKKMTVYAEDQDFVPIVMNFGAGIIIEKGTKTSLSASQADFLYLSLAHAKKFGGQR